MSATDSPRANSARVYEYIVAGETPGVPFTPADLAMASYITEHHPNTAQSMALNHLFIQVTVRAFQEAGIRHYIDIGAGLPTEGALHEQIEAGASVCTPITIQKQSPLGSNCWLTSLSYVTFRPASKTSGRSLTRPTIFSTTSASLAST